MVSPNLSYSNPTASYSYDANGNQTTRNINALTYNLVYDVENRLVGVNGATTASYVYDGDGVRVQAVESGVTTTYVNSLYEVTENQPLSVPNSGFENGAWTTQGSTGFPATSFYRGGSGVAAPNSGNNSQTTSNLANGWVDSASISVSAGATYDVYAYLHGEFDANDSNGQWKIQVVYSNGLTQSQPVTVDYGFTIGTTWQYEGGQVVVPAGMTSMKVRLVNETNSGWIAFDDLEVYLIKNGTREGSNLMSDGGFENSISFWATQVQTDFPGTAFYRGSSGIAAPHTGTYAYSISNLAYGTLESPDITVSASTSYTVYAYLRGELDAHDSNGSWMMRVKYYTSSGTYISQADVSTGTSLTTTWTLKGGTVTTPATAARMRVQFINQMNAGWLAVDDLAVKRSNWPIYIWGFDSDGTWTTSTQSGFSNTTSFYRGGSGIAAPREGTSAYAISNLANGMLVSEAMVTIPSTTYTVNAYLHGEMDSVGSEGNWQINACFYKFDGAPSSCSILTSGSAPAANWTQVSGTVTSPADAATMKLELVGAQLSGWLAWDDVTAIQGQIITKYYYAGSQRVALRRNGALNYLLGDHLGSASVVTDAGGSLLSKMLYKPWGETRYSSGTMPIDRLYTGQVAEAGLGLYFYNARWYDSSLSRFVQADTIIPGARNPMAWDRYAYSSNNPVNYIDPSGHISIPVSTDICGPDGLYCENRRFSQSSISKVFTSESDRKAAARTIATYQDDPGYFFSLYMDPGNSWGNSADVAYLDAYAHYNLGMSAEELVLSTYSYLDPFEIRTARFQYLAGDIETGDAILAAAVTTAVGGYSLPFADPLASQIKTVIDSIDTTGTPPSGVRQGGSYQNGVYYPGVYRGGGLPTQPFGHYTETDVWSGLGPRGPYRLVFGRFGEVYFTPNHYGSFIRIR